ncbi:MAG: hypothetical protein KUG69_10370 [Marinosulfonomonas sp.]|nr:hypothetical protein [Marinosulfonomonas sp.]
MKYFKIAIAVLLVTVPGVSARDLTDAERLRIENKVKFGLKDPFSAVFEWPSIDIKDPNRRFVENCGWVNAKNAYGAYVGFE